MQPSTWNDTNQHWIPQFLLKGFGIPRKASSVCQLDKQTKAFAVRKVSEAASKPRLVTDRDDELMREIERLAAPAVNAIRKGDLNRIGLKERQVIGRLVCAMMLNDPYSDIDTDATRKETIAEVTAKLNEALNKSGGMIDEQTIRNSFDERLNHDYLSVFMNSTSNQVILPLSLMGLRAYRPIDGEFFIIGDSPILVARNVVNGESSLLNPGSQVILPISSGCILVYAWATEMNVITDGGILGREQVRSLNSDYYHETNSRYVYGRDEEVLKRSRLMSLEKSPRERSNDVKDGWFRMQHEQQIRQRQMESQDAAHARMLENEARELVEITIAESEDHTI